MHFNNSNIDEPMQANNTNQTYNASTRGINVSVSPTYLEDQSNSEEGRHVWAYTIEISNRSDITVQLKDRTWKITDGNGDMEEVHGPGVVGEQPILNPGDAFQYTSGCPLRTPSGFMVGHYTMQSESGEKFDIDIPAFALDLPDAVRIMN